MKTVTIVIISSKLNVKQKMNRESHYKNSHTDGRITEAEGDAFEKNLKSEKRTTVVTRSGSGVQRHHKKHSNSTVRLTRTVQEQVRCVSGAQSIRKVQCVCLIYTLRVLRMVLCAAALQKSNSRVRLPHVYSACASHGSIRSSSKEFSYLKRRRWMKHRLRKFREFCGKKSWENQSLMSSYVEAYM